MAYSEEQIAMERAIAQTWQQKWSSIRARAAPIIAGNTPDDFKQQEYVGEVQTIELIVDDDDDYGSELDYEA